MPKTSGRLWISPYSAGQDPSATRQGQPATVASRNQGRAYPGTRPAPIAVLDVIKASEEAPRDAIDGRPGRHFESVPGYHQLHMVSQIVQDALCRVRIADIGRVAVKSNLALFETGRRPSFVRSWF